MKKSPNEIDDSLMGHRERVAKQWISTVNDALRSGYPPIGRNTETASKIAAEHLGVSHLTLVNNVGTPEKPGLFWRDFGICPDWALYEPVEQPFAVESTPDPSFISGPVFELVSSSDNRFVFGAAGDLHAASKYTRWDVREDLYKWFIEEGAQCNFDTGNWIEGEARFNIRDLEVHGLDSQLKLLADRHPRGLMTCAIWGDDHEGWYVQREEIDVGRYAADVMQSAGHEWVDLGYLEAHVRLRNANSGKCAYMALAHPGGGSAYALSYSVQKIIESLEGGEKPAVAMYGHYHKLWAGLIRNVWVGQTGTQQDQTPFQRKKRIEAHVGGMLATLHQDPNTGAITRFKPELARYFNKSYYGGSGRWSRHGPVILPTRGRS